MMSGTMTTTTVPTFRHLKFTSNESFQLHLRISYCSADATYDRVFAFIATNKNETLECHAFLCPKRKMVRK